jgi:ABC-type transport system involved in multi-copper enzyme maturation permease subunit
MAASTPSDRTLRHRLRRLLADNPVVLKELRGRMRGARAFIVLTIYLGLLGAFSALIYVAVSESATRVSGQVNVGEIGRTLFGGVVAIEMLLVSFIAPAFTSGAISGEREHQTYDLLRTTLLPSQSLVWGKLVSALSFVLLLLLAAIPLQSIAFFFGGVAETEVILSFVILTATALLFSTIGLYFSARSSRTLSASVLTYALATFIMFGLPIVLGSVLWIIEPSLDNIQSAQAERAVIYALGFIISTNPAATALMSQYILVNQRTTGTFAYTLNNGQDMTLISPWVPFTVLYVLLTVVFFVLAVRRVRVIEE